LFAGFTIAATGGPLALVALNVPGAIGSFRSIGLTSALAAVVFVAPLMVWWRYSERVASAGGLFSFVEAAAGRPIAFVQGGVWIVSYALYLPYTIDYIVYDLLPVALPGIKPYRSLLEIVLPAVIASLGFVAVRQAMRVVAVLAIGQVALVLLFTMAGLAHLGSGSHTFGAQGSVASLAKGTGNVALLFICSSLALFLGAETASGGRTVRRGLPVGYAIAAAAVVVGVLPWARAGRSELDAEIPGATLAQAAWGHWFGVVVALGVAASVGGVVIAEYFALSRLVHAMSGRPLSQTTRAVAVFFIATSAVAIGTPGSFYNDLVKPSLIALWVSQILVFIVYPRFAAMRGRARAGAIALATVASTLAGYGLYTAFTSLTS
jgi:amino acid transporter